MALAVWQTTNNLIYENHFFLALEAAFGITSIFAEKATKKYALVLRKWEKVVILLMKNRRESKDIFYNSRVFSYTFILSF